MLEAGFSTYAVGYVPSHARDDGVAPDARLPFLLLDWPKTWLTLYATEGFAAEDILLVEAARRSEPFTWTEVRDRHPGASARVFQAAARWGWLDGFVIPVHTPFAPAHERFGVVSLAAGRLDGFGAEQRTAVVSISLTAFAQARRLAAGGVLPGGGPVLTAREREALTYVAEGLGDAEIGAAMGVTRATAHFHVERAKRTLSASTRAQAIAIALTQGLL